MRSYKKTLLLIIGVIFIIVLMRYLFQDYVTLEQLKNNRDTLMKRLENNYIFTVLLYLAIYIMVIALSIPGFAPLTLIGGCLFGVLPAVIYALIGCTLGSLIFFFTVRYVLRGIVIKRYGVKLQKFNMQMERYGELYLLSLQLLSVIPYFVINTLAALTQIPWVTFAWTTILGALPLLFVYAFAGQQLTTITSVKDIFSLRIMIVLLMLAFCALLPIVTKRLRSPSNDYT